MSKGPESMNLFEESPLYEGERGLAPGYKRNEQGDIEDAKGNILGKAPSKELKETEKEVIADFIKNKDFRGASTPSIVREKALRWMDKREKAKRAKENPEPEKEKKKRADDEDPWLH